jgi:hypothetical protein
MAAMPDQTMHFRLPRRRLVVSLALASVGLSVATVAFRLLTRSPVFVDPQSPLDAALWRLRLGGPVVLAAGIAWSALLPLFRSLSLRGLGRIALRGGELVVTDWLGRVWALAAPSARLVAARDGPVGRCLGSRERVWLRTASDVPNQASRVLLGGSDQVPVDALRVALDARSTEAPPREAAAQVTLTHTPPWLWEPESYRRLGSRMPSWLTAPLVAVTVVGVACGVGELQVPRSPSRGVSECGALLAGLDEALRSLSHDRAAALFSSPETAAAGEGVLKDAVGEARGLKVLGMVAAVDNRVVVAMYVRARVEGSRGTRPAELVLGRDLRHGRWEIERLEVQESGASVTKGGGHGALSPASPATVSREGGHKAPGRAATMA